MSFLQELCKKKSLLKSTDTVVTCADGRRFIESKNQPTVEVKEKKYGFVVDNKPDNVPAKIVEYLYLGSQDCCEESVLNHYNIRSVLSVGIQPTNFIENIEYKFVNCLDLPETDINSVILDCVPFIKKNIQHKTNLLVHCNAGVSRSSAVVIGFLMLENNISYDEAYSVVKQLRNCIKPNNGFQSQLKILK